jgi:hypothetical protein
MYITLSALAGSLLLFMLRWRRSDSVSWKAPAVIAGILIIAGCIFLFKHAPEEVMFMDYIEMRFYPFWCLTLASFFMVKCIMVMTRKKS